METFKANISELEGTATDLKSASEELHSLFEEYAQSFLSSAGLAYEEGTEVYEALHEGVKAAVNKAETNVEMLLEQSGKASQTAQNIEETEGTSVNRIRSNIGVN